MKSLAPKADLQILSDEELLFRSLDNPALFEELVNRHRRAFIRRALAIVGNEDEAHDVVQETFVRIYIAAQHFKKIKGATFKSWAYTILTNQSYTSYGRNKKRLTISLDAEPDLADRIPDQAELDNLEKVSTREYVLQLISGLPELLKRVTTLHFIDGLGQKEIARMLGVGPGVIRTRLYRARNELRRLNLQIVIT